jgi:serine protease
MVVAAAGNESVDTPVFPAALDGVIAVGAVDMNKELASYSNFGNYLDVVAPGGDDTPDLNGDGMPDGILSTVGNEVGTGSRKQKIEFTFASSSGTSMASPHVAGVIALMKAVNPNLTPQGFDDLLKNGSLTEDLGTRGRDDEFGYGLLNAQKAVLAAIELNDNPPPPAPALLVVNPGSLNFGISRSSAKLTLTNGGSDELVIHNITEDSDGFLSIEGQGLGDYIVKVDRNRLSTVGTYTATITIKTNANTVQVPVILQISDSDVTGDAGYHYILLIDPDTLETIQEIDASPTKGVYYYQFNNVPNGTYIIAAGSDFNNDGYICDVGEACGSYLTLDNPTSINVNSQNHGELNFTTGFNVSFMPKAASATTVPVPSRGFARLKHGHELAP